MMPDDSDMQDEWSLERSAVPKLVRESKGGSCERTEGSGDPKRHSESEVENGSSSSMRGA